MTASALATPRDYAKYFAAEYKFSMFVLRNPDGAENATEKELKIRKRPALESWEPYKHRCASEEEIDAWFDEDPNYNIAVVTGSISKIIGIDVDGNTAVKRIQSKIPQMSNALRTAFANTMKNRTGSGGEHVIFKIHDNIDDISQEIIWKDGEPHSGIVLQGNDHYLAMPPSRHPNGKLYEWNGKGPELIPRQLLNEFIRLVQPDQQQAEVCTEKSQEPPIESVPVEEKSNLTTDEMHDLLNLLEPVYKPGSRNFVILYLSGMLRKSGFSHESTRALIDALCTESPYDDEDLEKSLDVVDRNYAKPINKLMGKSGLHRLLVSGYESKDQNEYLDRAERFSRICQIINAGAQEPSSSPSSQAAEESDNKNSGNANRTPVLSVSEAILAEEGYCAVNGTLSTMWLPYDIVTGEQFRCSDCGSVTQVNYKYPLQYPKWGPAGRSKGFPNCSGCTKNTTQQFDKVFTQPAMNIELLDTEKFEDIKRMAVILTKNHVMQVRAGERLVIRGNLRVLQNKSRKGAGKYYRVLYAEIIEFEDREEIELLQVRTLNP